jgi:hypothetical protein
MLPGQHNQTEAEALHAHVNEGVVLDEAPPLSSFLAILKDKQGSGRMSGTRLLCLQVSTHSLNADAASSSEAQAPTILVWLPEPLVRRVLPRMVQLYDEKKAARQSRLNVKVRASPGGAMLVSL